MNFSMHALLWEIYWKIFCTQNNTSFKLIRSFVTICKSKTCFLYLPQKRMWGLWEGIKTEPQHNFKMKPINLHKPRKKLINAIWNENVAWTSNTIDPIHKTHHGSTLKTTHHFPCLWLVVGVASNWQKLIRFSILNFTNYESHNYACSSIS